MKGKDLLGSVSPLYGAVSGHGFFGKNDLGGALGLISANRRDKRKEARSKEVADDMKASGVQKFNKGGRVDGCAIRGMTKGKKL
jgi:hypothetical protein